jgi:Flp pilus assembly protein TadD
MRLWLVIIGLALGTACGAARRSTGSAEEIPAWRTEDGQKGVWRDLAVWYIDNDMPDKALEMITRLRESGADSAELLLLQGRALVAQGMPEEARTVLELAREDMRKDPRPHQELGIVYADLGEYDLAVESLRTALQFDADDTRTRNNLGFLLLAMDLCEEATAELEQVLAADASNSRYRNNLAFSLVCSGEPTRALKLFRSTGSEAEARYNMGVAYERLDKLSSALLQYQQALEVDPKHEPAREALTRLEPLGLSPDEPLQGVE